MQGVAFVGGAVHTHDLGSFALSHWLNPPKEALPDETLAAVCAFAVYDNGDFIKAALSGFLNLDEAAQRTNDSGRQVRARQLLSALEEWQIVLGYVDRLVRHLDHPLWHPSYHTYNYTYI